MKARLTMHDVREYATTLVDILREEPNDQRAILILIDHLLVFQGHIQAITLQAVQDEVLKPLMRGVEDRITTPGKPSKPS